MSGSQPQRHTSASLVSLWKPDAIKPAVWFADGQRLKQQPRAQQSANLRREGGPWIQSQQLEEGMRGFLSEAGLCFCFKTPYLCWVRSASTHLTALSPHFFFLLTGLQPQTVSLSALPLTCNIALLPKHPTFVPKFSHFTAPAMQVGNN